MYQTQKSIHSVISISLTQNISDIKFVRGRCQDIATFTNKVMSFELGMLSRCVLLIYELLLLILLYFTYPKWPLTPILDPSWLGVVGGYERV